MMLTRRKMIASIMTGVGATVLGVPLARGSDWREKFLALNFGVVSSENEADRIVVVSVIDLLSKSLRLRIIHMVWSSGRVSTPDLVLLRQAVREPSREQRTERGELGQRSRAQRRAPTVRSAP